MSMKWLTVMVLVGALAEPVHILRLRKITDATNAIGNDLQEATKEAEEIHKIVGQDLQLLHLILNQDLSPDDLTEIQEVVEEDQSRIETAYDVLESALMEVERMNVRAELSLLYRAGNQSLSLLKELREELDDIAVSFSPQTSVPDLNEAQFIEVSPDQSNETETVKIQVPEPIKFATPSVDQMLQIASCLETLLRAHKDANDILGQIQGEEEAIEAQQAVLNQRKDVLRATVTNSADTLEKHRVLVAEAKEKVARAIEALQESERLLEEKAELITQLQLRLFA